MSKCEAEEARKEEAAALRDIRHDITMRGLKLYENSVFIINILSAGVCGRASRVKVNDISTYYMQNVESPFFSVNSRERISLIKIECYLISLFFLLHYRKMDGVRDEHLSSDIKIDINVNLLRVHKSAHYIKLKNAITDN